MSDADPIFVQPPVPDIQQEGNRPRVPFHSPAWLEARERRQERRAADPKIQQRAIEHAVRVNDNGTK